MKNWKHYGIVCLMAFIVSIFITCDKDKETSEVTRVFNDLELYGKNIKIIDETNNVQDLKTRGIWKLLKDGLNQMDLWAIDAENRGSNELPKIRFFPIYETGSFAIIIEDNAIYQNGFFGFNDNKILLSDNILMNLNATEIAECIGGAIIEISGGY